MLVLKGLVGLHRTVQLQLLQCYWLGHRLGDRDQDHPHGKEMQNGIWSHHFTANRWGNNGNSDRLYFLGLQKSLQMVTLAMKLKDACSLEEKL